MVLTQTLLLQQKTDISFTTAYTQHLNVFMPPIYTKSVPLNYEINKLFLFVNKLKSLGQINFNHNKQV